MGTEKRLREDTLTLTEAVVEAREAAKRRTKGPSVSPEGSTATANAPDHPPPRPDVHHGPDAEALPDEGAPTGDGGANDHRGNVWKEAVDPATGCSYYYHEATGSTQWDPPGEGYMSARGVMCQSLPEAEPEALPDFPEEAWQPSSSGWCYRDGNGTTQGPFTEEKYRAWVGAGMLPARTPVFRQGQPLQWVELHRAVGTAPPPQEAPPQDRCEYDYHHEAQSMPEPSAYPEANAAAIDPPGGTSSLYAEYAAAALAGLPANDEAVKMAQLAAAAGQTIEDIIRFSYASGEAKRSSSGAQGDSGIVTAMYDPRTGRISQPVAQEEASVYAGMESWVDTNSLEDSLQAMKDRKQKKFRPEVWKRLKARRQELREKVKKQEMSWLYQ